MLRQLAPNQCVLFRSTDAQDGSLPQACAAFAERAVDAPFWLADFTVRDRDGVERTCRAATPGRLTICVMPR